MPRQAGAVRDVKRDKYTTRERKRAIAVLIWRRLERDFPPLGLPRDRAASATDGEARARADRVARKFVEIMANSSLPVTAVT